MYLLVFIKYIYHNAYKYTHYLFISKDFVFI